MLLREFLVMYGLALGRKEGRLAERERNNRYVAVRILGQVTYSKPA